MANVIDQLLNTKNRPKEEAMIKITAKQQQLIDELTIEFN